MITDQIRVLFIDDDQDLLSLAKRSLEEISTFSVDVTESPQQGLEMIQSGIYDGVVSDYEMPQMNGLELLRKVRELGNRIPFIIFTGRGREDVVIEALNSGADFYLQKGGEPQSQFTELAHKIQSAVKQRKAEESIHDHERREADIINFLPDATLAIDTNGIVIAWNRAMEEMTGVSASEMLGKGNYEYALPLYQERRPILIDLVLNEDPGIAEKYPFLKREGENLVGEITSPSLFNGRGATIWFTAAPLYDTHGTIIGAIESIRDITDRKESEIELLKKNYELQAAYEQISVTEEDLRSHLDNLTRQEQLVRESEEQFQALFMNMIEGAVLHDLIYDNQGNPQDYVIIKANPAFESQLGISREEVMGKTSREAYGVDTPPYLDIYARVAETKKPEVFETYFKPLNKHFSISVYCPYKGSFATFSEDITKRKEAEEAIRVQYTTLAATEENLRHCLSLIHI